MPYREAGREWAPGPAFSTRASASMASRGATLLRGEGERSMGGRRPRLTQRGGRAPFPFLSLQAAVLRRRGTGGGDRCHFWEKAQLETQFTQWI